MNTIATYQLEAYNTSKNSDNKIHDDTVAKKFGFEGGLVPGVDVYAYLTHPAVNTWGQNWLVSGSCDCLLIKPVYDGAIATVKATFEDAEQNSMKIKVESAGQLCAEGTAQLYRAALEEPNLEQFSIAPLPRKRPLSG